MPWLVISELTAKGRVAPVVASRAPTPVALTPLRESNRPPTTTWPGPASTIASTELLVIEFCWGLSGRLLPAVEPTPGRGAHRSRAPPAPGAAGGAGRG